MYTECVKPDRDKTVSFTGYRLSQLYKTKDDPKILSSIADTLILTIEELFKAGYTTFLSGMTEGFGLMAAETVLNFRDTGNPIELWGVSPYIGQEAGYSAADKKRYARLFKKADVHIATSYEYHKYAYQDHTDYLVDNASQIVCYYDGQNGTVKHTVTQAMKAELPIINIFTRL